MVWFDSNRDQFVGLAVPVLNCLRVIGYGIDARRQRFPDERSYVYKPHKANGEKYVWNDAAKVTLHDYNLLDLGL